MIRIFQNIAPSDREPILEQAFRLRHRVFVEEKGWHDLARPDGREIDDFDHAEAVHLCVTRGTRLVAYARLLPTTRPHLLSDVLSMLCTGREVPRGIDTMEWTRHCVAADHRGGGIRLGSAETELIEAIVATAAARGVRRLTAEGHPAWTIRLKRLGFGVEALCDPVEIAGEPAIGMLISPPAVLATSAGRRRGGGLAVAV